MVHTFRTGYTYTDNVSGKSFTVIDVEEHDFDPDLTQVEVVFEDGDWAKLYAGDTDATKESGPADPTDEPCDCQFSAYGYNDGKYYCLACGGQ